MHIRIEDYKRISEIYRISERNGKGKEYNKLTENMIFEGEYLNGKKWNGKGYNKEGEIDFEINKGNGKVKEFYVSNKLKYEGNIQME